MAFPGPAGISVGRTSCRMREGVSADGRRLAPPMAFAAYRHLAPSDLADLVAYLRSQPPQP
jgi:hypothetical protein